MPTVTAVRHDGCMSSDTTTPIHHVPTLPEFVKPAGLTPVTPASGESTLRNVLTTTATAITTGTPLIQVATHTRVDPTQLQDACAAMGTLIGHILKSSRHIGTVTISSGHGTITTTEHGVHNVHVAHGWATRTRRIKRAYAMIATAEPELISRVITTLIDRQNVPVTTQHYTDLYLTDTLQSWALDDLSTNPNIMTAWNTAWDSVRRVIDRARYATSALLSCPPHIGAATVAAALHYGPWLLPQPDLAYRLTGITNVTDLNRAANTLIDQLRSLAGNYPHRVVPTRLRHLSDSQYQRVIAMATSSTAFPTAAHTRTDTATYRHIEQLVGETVICVTTSGLPGGVSAPARQPHRQQPVYSPVHAIVSPM